MYDLWFYGFYWVAGFLLAFPVLIIGFVYAHLKPPPPPPKIPTLKELDQAFRNIQDKESYDAIFQDFIRYYQVLPKGTKEGDWLEFVGKLAESEFFGSRFEHQIRAGLRRCESQTPKSHRQHHWASPQIQEERLKE
ncbi:hypothetical protein HBZS_116290 [Helicobacter bizzozeronii CCUG 35545]|nr:hypothetical protein HBZS_116290 [Helicobacter bizzozeronii CCUG 35545]